MACPAMGPGFYTAITATPPSLRRAALCLPCGDADGKAKGWAQSWRMGRACPPHGCDLRSGSCGDLLPHAEVPHLPAHRHRPGRPVTDDGLRRRQPGAARPPGLRPGPCACPPLRAGQGQAVPADPPPARRTPPRNLPPQRLTPPPDRRWRTGPPGRAPPSHPPRQPASPPAAACPRAPGQPGITQPLCRGCVVDVEIRSLRWSWSGFRHNFFGLARRGRWSWPARQGYAPGGCRW